MADLEGAVGSYRGCTADVTQPTPTGGILDLGGQRVRRAAGFDPGGFAVDLRQANHAKGVAAGSENALMNWSG